MLRHTTLIPRLTSEVTHRVRPGDTLPEIAAKYGTSVTGIISFNEFSDTTILNVGAELAIPSSLGWDVISQAANAPESKSSLDRPDIAAGNLVQTFNQTTSSTN